MRSVREMPLLKEIETLKILTEAVTENLYQTDPHLENVD
ncbi:hypothetical protein MC7420_2161 [Coleofasciculus chthonoplastes PCC 7420]|uniref:Uncharacterized protein n=1 Tax=Coleofasciculus chthonoplastes PCC 7420 TaxID=118168 RepID=B4VS74_9CYAN|nr:hypothetical protein MC7420_2161 [Coleofasciculus chthonoplastes PCC 7420]